MEPCANQFIPDRLHTDDRPHINKFEVGDVVYRRCKNNDIDNPFENLKLADVSVNRQCADRVTVSEQNDVLFNLNATDDENLYYEESILTITVEQIDEEEGTYYKAIPGSEVSDDEDAKKHTLTMRLSHHRLPCNYAHCVFDITYDEQLVTWDNKDQLLGKGVAKKLRNRGRFELAKMITYRQIWINPPQSAA